MPEQAYAMVFAPHPDDEGGAGGTMVRWAREGKDVILVICTNGDKGTNDPKIKPEELAKTREEEQRAAAEVLGAREVIFLGHPDQTLTDTPEFRKEITRLIRQYQPEVVATVDSQRRYMSHPDHRNTGQVVLNAVSLYARNLYSFPDLYFEEGLELHQVKEVLLWGAEAPNYCSDITDTFDVKMAAQQCHKSQFGEPTPERAKRMRERYKTQAEKEEFELGEAFHRIEMRRPPPPPPETPPEK
ncbi:MAG: PIG-L deacetylase family protein [Dehalococcoidales bacterium]